MLILSRRPGEEIIIGNQIRLIVVSIKGNRVRLGFRAPPETSICRRELAESTPPAETSPSADAPPPAS